MDPLLWQPFLVSWQRLFHVVLYSIELIADILFASPFLLTDICFTRLPSLNFILLYRDIMFSSVNYLLKLLTFSLFFAFRIGYVAWT